MTDTFDRTCQEVRGHLKHAIQGIKDHFFPYFISYQKEIMQQEKLIFQKFQKQDAMSKLIPREILLHRDLT